VKRQLAVEIDRAVQACTDALNDASHDAAAIGSEESLALWRLHTAAVLGSLLTYLLVPAWREFPDLAPEGQPAHQPLGMLLPLEAAQRGKAAAGRVKHLLTALSSTSPVPELADGLAEVRRRLSEFEEYLDVAIASHGVAK